MSPLTTIIDEKTSARNERMITTNNHQLISTNLNQKETSLAVFSGQSSLTQTFIDNISVPILHLVYQVISNLKSFEKLRNVKLGMAALIIYYGGLLAFLLNRNNDSKLISIYERYRTRGRNIIYSIQDPNSNKNNAITSSTTSSLLDNLITQAKSLLFKK